MRVYFQFLPHEDVAGVVREIEASLAAFAQADPFFSAHPLEIQRLFDPPLLGHVVPADHPWTQCLHGAAEGVLGDEVASVLRTAEVYLAAALAWCC